MIKFKYNIEKNEALLKALEPKIYSFLLLWFCFFGGAIGYDLGLKLFTAFCSGLFFFQIGWFFCWLVHSFVHLIIKNVRKKKEVKQNEDK